MRIHHAILNGQNAASSGSKVHAVDYGDRGRDEYMISPALCGKKPGPRSAGWVPVSREITCDTCLGKAAGLIR